MSTFKRFRFTIRFLSALITKYYLALFMGIFLGIGSFILTPRLIKFVPHARTTHTTAVVGRFTQADIPLVIQQKLSIGLTSIDSTGQASPALAAGWEVQDNGLTYVFKLHPNFTWQDGSPVKASDINYQFRDTETQYPADDTVIIKLKDAYAPLPVVVSRPIFKSGLLGLGGYRAAAVKKNGNFLDSLTLVPTDTQSQLPKLVYRFYPTEEQARLAYKLGLVQSLEELAGAGDLTTWPNSRLEQVTHYDRYVAVFFNTANTAFKGAAGKNLRQALAYAIDKSTFPNRTYSPIAATSWAYNPEVKKYDYDVNHAQQLLENVKVPEKLTLHTSAAYLEVAEKIKQDWEALGIPTDIITTAEVPADFEALLIAQAIPTDPDQYNQWHSTQGTNLTGINSPRIDKLLEDGRKTVNLDQRKTIYRDFQRFLVEEAPAVFLFHPQSYTAIRN